MRYLLAVLVLVTAGCAGRANLKIAAVPVQAPKPEQLMDSPDYECRFLYRFMASEVERTRTGTWSTGSCTASLIAAELLPHLEGIDISVEIRARPRAESGAAR